MLARLVRALVTLGGWIAWTAILVSLIDFDDRGALAAVAAFDRATPACIVAACALLALAALCARPREPLTAALMLLIVFSWTPSLLSGVPPLEFTAWRWVRVVGFAVLTVHLFLRMGATKTQLVHATGQALGRQAGVEGVRWWRG